MFYCAKDSELYGEFTVSFPLCPRASTPVSSPYILFLVYILKVLESMGFYISSSVYNFWNNPSYTANLQFPSLPPGSTPVSSPYTLYLVLLF